MNRSTPSQRDRILDGVIAATARFGYRETSVARVIEQAGVSRATFYEHFEDKEACFHAAYRGVSSMVKGVLQRAVGDREIAERARPILTELLATAERDPASARLLLIEALAAGGAVRKEHEELLGFVEKAIDQYLREVSNRGRVLQIPSRALLGGIGNVLAIRVFQGETGGLVDLVDELLAWIDTYAMPTEYSGSGRVEWPVLGRSFGATVERAPATDPLLRPLPRGKSALPRGVVAAERRTRIVAAAARVASEKGYSGMTVADIVATAGVTREAYYEQFRNKEDALLAAQAMGLQESIAMAASEFFAEAEWPDRVWNSATEMVGYVSQHPDLAFVQLVASYEVGSAAIRRTFDARMAYTLFLEDGYRQSPAAESVPRLSSEAIAGAILEILRQEAVKGRTERMLEILPEAVYVATAPFIGPVGAIELVQGKVAAAIS
jgi:AcrR family transcriptional regulator